MGKELETVAVPAVEIMAEGTWNGDPYTRADLDAIVASFSDLQGRLDPPVKLGHDDSQKIAQKDGFPAVGWVTRLYRKGGKLIADLRDVPKRIAELISAGAYQKVSAEIYFDKEVDGTTYPRILKAIALLGGDMPAVRDIQSIGDIEGLYAALFDPADAHYVEYGDGSRNLSMTITLPDGMSLDDLQGALRSAVADIPGLDADHLWVTDVAENAVVISTKGGSYISFPFSLGESGRVTITGPGTAVRRVTTWQAATADAAGSTNVNANKEGDVELKTLIKTLGMPEDATEEQVTARLAELAKPAAAPAGQPEGNVAKLTEDLRASNERILTLERERATERAYAEVDAAITTGKFVPAQQEDLRAYALRDPEGFKKFVENSPKLAILGGPLGSEGDTPEGVEPTEAEKAIARQMGVTPAMLELGKKPLAQLVEENKDKVGGTALAVSRS